MEKNNQEKIHILLVEDDVNLGYLLVENLHAKGIRVTLAQTGRDGINAISKGGFDLCILDIMLPEIDGFKLGSRLKSLHPSIPFIFLSARMLEADRINGFETGADDYVMKPFSFKELYYRILVILKRRNIAVLPVEEPGLLSVGSAVLNTKERILSVNGVAKKLSRREADVLSKLMQQPGNYVSRSEILKKVWGNDDYFSAKSMDVYITRIRKLLKDEPSLEIENLYGSGYRIRKGESNESIAP
jgi:DNA-binding response OmpR family regulator